MPTELLVLLSTVFGLLVYLWIFWGFYVLVMGIYRAWLDKRLNRLTLCLSLPFVVIGFVLDVLANFFVATFVFLELPHEWLVTSRLVRLQGNVKGDWRRTYADWICYNLLDVFDPTGYHCLKEDTEEAAKVSLPTVITS